MIVFEDKKLFLVSSGPYGKSTTPFLTNEIVRYNVQNMKESEIAWDDWSESLVLKVLLINGKAEILIGVNYYSH